MVAFKQHGMSLRALHFVLWISATICLSICETYVHGTEFSLSLLVKFKDKQ